MRFSVIVPVYGVEKYLGECISSILAQTYEDFEVILVDDKSPDNCPAMCDGYAARDSRVRVIHKEKNEGPGYARNTGVEAAKGEYAVFVDSDDHISPNMLAEYNRALQNGEDVLACGMILFRENKKGQAVRSAVLRPEAFYAEDSKAKADAFGFLTEERLFPYVWNKAYRREFLISSGQKFEKTKLMEDFLFNVSVFADAEKIRIINDCFYFYRKPRHETLTSKYFPDFFEATKRKYEKEKTFLLACGGFEKWADAIREGYIKHLISTVIRNRSKSANLSKARQKELISEMMKDPVTAQVVQEFTPKDLKYKLIRNMLAKRKIGLFYSFCKWIGIIQSL